MRLRARASGTGLPRTAPKNAALPDSYEAPLALLNASPRRDAALGLQRAAGNMATVRMLQRDAIDDEKVRDQDRGDRRAVDSRRGSRRDRGLPPDPFDNFDSDWAGRMILGQYLYGEGRPVDVRDDAHWTEYMTRSDRLRKQVWLEVVAMAEDLAKRGTGRMPIVRSFHAEVENGEGIIGYQYLHGTNEKVGDFRIFAWATVSPLRTAGIAWMPGQNPFVPRPVKHGEGTRVDFEATFVWNDLIDPNAGYFSDKIKDAFAEYVTLGGAQSYRLSIGWRGRVTVFLNAGGGRQLVGGYPEL